MGQVDASGTPYVNLTRWGADYGLAGTVPKDIVYELTFDEVLTTDECTGAFNITVGGVKEFVPAAAPQGMNRDSSPVRHSETSERRYFNPAEVKIEQHRS